MAVIAPIAHAMQISPNAIEANISPTAPTKNNKILINDINKDTRAQLELINVTLSELQV